MIMSLINIGDRVVAMQQVLSQVFSMHYLIKYLQQLYRVNILIQIIISY